MSDELSALIRASADAEAAHAAREHPFTPTAIDRYVRDARRRRVVHATVLAVAGAIVVSGTALAVARPWGAVPPADEPTREPTSEVTTPDEEGTPTPTAEAMPPATPAPVATAPAPPETSEPEEEPPPPDEEEPPPPPGAVTILSVGPGGGSGEVLLSWAPVPEATGYRVYRSDSPDGPFLPAASYDVATGTATDEYTGGHEYISIYLADPNLVYVEAAGGVLAYLQVVAFNDGGEGPRSATMCGEPMAQGYTCPA